MKKIMMLVLFFLIVFIVFALKNFFKMVVKIEPGITIIFIVGMITVFVLIFAGVRYNV